MSYVRFSQADLYIYDDVRGYTTCCGCVLDTDPKTTDLAAMLAHVQAHRHAGHDVPAWLEQELTDEWWPA